MRVAVAHADQGIDEYLEIRPQTRIVFVFNEHFFKLRCASGFTATLNELGNLLQTLNR